MKRAIAALIGSVIIYGALLGANPELVVAFWDSLDGPMGEDVKSALETGDAAHVMKWVHLKDEPKVLAAFQQTMALRTKYPKQSNILDRSFFGTLMTIRQDATLKSEFPIPSTQL
jgi:hypothetical protein